MSLKVHLGTCVSVDFVLLASVVTANVAYDEAYIVYLFVNSGYAGPVCGAVNPSCS